MVVVEVVLVFVCVRACRRDDVCVCRGRGRWRGGGGGEELVFLCVRARV